MSILKCLDISASALTAQRFRMDVIGENIANAEVTRTANGEPYRRKVVVMSERPNAVPFKDHLKNSASAMVGNGAVVSQVVEDPSDFKYVHNPDHPDADENGYVRMPNVDTITEMVDLMSASRAYEANITAFNTSKNMALKALEIGKIVEKCLSQEFSIKWDGTVNNQIEINPFKWDKSFDENNEYEIEGAYETFVKGD